MIFISSSKLFSFSGYLNFCLDFWSCRRNVNFKIYQVTAWLTINYNTYIVIRNKNITREIFFFKNHARNEAGRLVPDFFFFSKKTLSEVKGSGLQVSFNILR